MAAVIKTRFGRSLACILWALGGLMGHGAALAVTSTTTLASSVNPTFVGQSTTLTATITGSSPTGTVTFKDGTATLGTGTISSGKATFAASFSTAGTHNLTAVYGGNGNNTASTSSVRSQTVNAKATTSTALTSSLNPSAVGQGTTLTATVTGTSPTGTVTFKDGSTTLGTGTVSAGKATYNASFSTTGAHSLTAVYAGDTGNSASTSSALGQTVNPKTSTTTALASSLNPSVIGQSTTLTATVTGTSPTGTVTFKDGSTTLGTGTVSAGKATYNASFSTAGAHSLTAVYAGDAGNNTSTSSALSQTVTPKTSTTTALTSSLSPSVVGQGTTLTATVTGTSPTGTVTFKDGTTTLGTGTISAGKATYIATFSATGAHSLTAVYAGDSGNNTSTSSTLTQTVNPKTASSTALTSSSNPTVVGQITTLTATVTGTSPTGTVTFKDGTTTLGTGTVSAGKATYAATFSATGTRSLTAVYAGDSTNTTSTSAVLSQAVAAKATTTTALASSVNPSLTSQSTTLTATVTGASPTGTVTFKDGTTTLGTATITADRATYTATFSTTGAHSLTAVYAGDTANNTSTSAALSQSVTSKVATTTTLTSSVNPSLIGQSTTLTATVTGTSPSGTVTFKDGTTTLGTGTISAGKATYDATFSITGTHSLTAVYAGDTVNNTSTSGAVSQTVNKATTTTALTSSVNPSGIGQSTTLTATVSGGSPTGSVTFRDGSTTLATVVTSAGRATYGATFSTSGTHNLTAVYAGDSLHNASTSSALAQTVSTSRVTTTTLTSSVNPAFIGQTSSLVARVTGTSLNGTLTILDGSTPLQTFTVTPGVSSYTGTLSTRFTSVGVHNLTATFTGDPVNTASTSAVVVENVIPPTTTLQSSVNPAYPGQETVLTATVSGGRPGGTVTFYDGDTAMTTLSLSPTSSSSKIFTSPMVFQNAGTRTLRAAYEGYDGAVSQGTLTQTVVTGSTPSSIVLTSQTNPSYSGANVVFTATVSGSNPTGYVTFMDGDTVLGVNTVEAGAAELYRIFPAAGTYSLSAIYSGDGVNAASTSASLAQRVLAPALVVTSGKNPSFPTQNVVLTATVTAPEGGAPPQGTVWFLEDGASLGSVTIDAGSASFATGARTVSFSTVGNHNVVANYVGNDGSSATTTLNQTVAAGAYVTSTSLTADRNPSYNWDRVTYSIRVTGANPTGLVTLMDGPITLGTATLSNGTAQIYARLSEPGGHTLVAKYSGDAVNAASNSPNFLQTINPAVPSTLTLQSSANPAVPGQLITVTATLTAVRAPEDYVAIRTESQSLTYTSFVAGAAPNTYVASTTTSFADAGTHSFIAEFRGDNANQASSAQISQNVVVGGTPTTTVLRSNVNPVLRGKPVVLTATVTGSNPTGPVTFMDGSTVLGTAQVSGGVATLPTNFYEVGGHTLSAVYSGDVNNAAGTSAPLAETVLDAVSTTTTMSSSINPSGPGQNTVLTVTVTGAGPTGWLSLNELSSGNSYGYGLTPMPDGVTATASINLRRDLPGIYRYTVSYGGDASNLASTSAELTQTVRAGTAPTTTVLTSSINPSTANKVTNLVAVVNGSNPTGYVDFKDGNTLLNSVLLSGGAATWNGALFSTTGAHNLTATYVGDAVNAGSVSPAVVQTVSEPIATTTALTFTNPAYAGQDIGLTITVTGDSPGGNVSIKEGNVVLKQAWVAYGSGVTTLNFPAVGTHTITASYEGDAANLPSTSAPAVLNVVPQTTSVTVLTSNLNPGQAGAIELTAAVTGTKPTGTVIFMDGDVSLGGSTFGGMGDTNTVTFRPVFTKTGTRSVTAVYSGNTANKPSTSAPLMQAVQPHAPNLWWYAPPAVNVGQPVALRVHINMAGAPEGVVLFMDGTTRLGTVVLTDMVEATLNVSFSTPGTHTLTAMFGGNGTNTSATSPPQTITVNASTSPTVLFSNIHPAYVGQSATLTAVVTPPTATGSITFKDEAAVLGTAPIVAGKAVLSTSFTTVGTHPLTAVYSGDGTNAANTSETLPLTVNAGDKPTVFLTASVNPVPVGAGTLLNALVISGAPMSTGTPPMGTVTFKDGNTVLGTGVMRNGAADLLAGFSTPGAHNVTAVYSGDGANSETTSDVLIIAAGGKLPSSVALASGTNPVPVNQTVALVASVSGSSSLDGTVTFQDGATVIGTAKPIGSMATLLTAFTTAGAHSLTAAYSGDAVANASVSSALVQTVTGQSVAMPTPPVSPAPVVNYEYDAKGNPTKTVLAPGVAGLALATKSAYDALDRRSTITDAKDGVTRMGYDGLDRTIKVTDPRLLDTTTPRTGLGDITQLVSPDTGTALRTYDVAGNLKTVTDSRGVLSTNLYDELNRLTSTMFSKSGETSLSYTWTHDETGTGFSNGVGRLTSAAHPAGSSQYAYDPLGKLITDTQVVNARSGANASAVTTRISYGYDAAGHLTSITYPSGSYLSIGHVNGLPSSFSLAKNMASAAVPVLGNIAHSPFGPPMSWQFRLQSGPQQMNRVFDNSGRLVRYPLGSYVRDLTYDAADRITSYIHYDAALGTATASASALNQNFGYDELGRLTTVGMGSTSWGLSYDANGNRTGVTLNGVASAYVTSATSNRLDSITNPSRSFGYDNAGNTVSDSAGYTSVYNLAGRLTALTKAGVTSNYDYDGSGKRIRKFSTVGPTATLIFAYDREGQVLGEYDSTGAAVREYVWMGNTPVAMFTPDPASASNPPLVYNIHADHLDTPRVVTDSTGNVRWRWLSEPFGTTAPETNPQGLGNFTQNLRFPGQYADAESGLFYNYFRDYDPTIGRYSASDPIGLGGGINTYTYVSENPVSLVDPKGLQIVIPAPIPVPIPAALGWCASNPAACALGGAAAGGYAGGSLLYPYIAEPLGDAIDWCAMAATGRWQCMASCNVQVINPALDGKVPSRVTGTSRGSTEPDACAAAKREATQSAPPGTYARHCQCSCMKN